MKKKSVYSILLVLTLTMVLIFGGLFTASVLAVDPILIEGNDPDASDLELPFLYKVKFDADDFFPGDEVTIDGITISVSEDGKFVDWDSSEPIVYVFVKGGNSGNLYKYEPPVYSDTDLHAPENNSGDYAGISHISFYIADVGELLITKEFILGDIEGIVDFPATITVLVTGPSYPDGELFVIDIDASGYGELLIENLIPGDYYVEELTFNGSEAWESDIVGSPFTVEGSGGISTLSVVSPEAVEITNTYNPGDLEITKLFVYEDGTQVDPADLPVGADFSFTVEVTGPSYPDGQLFTEADFTDGVLLLEDLYPGLYTVTETEYGTEWTVDVDGTETATVDVEVEPGMTGYVTIENIYNPGDLEITKLFVYEDGTQVDPADLPVGADFSFTVEVTGPSYPDGQLFTEADFTDGVLLLEDLYPGLYTVTETEYGTEWTVDVDGTETATVDVEVEPGMTGYVTIENIYNPGDLEITKLFVYEDGTQVDPADLPVGADFSFTVEVTGPSYPDGQLFTEADFTDGVLLLEDLYPGLYTVTETEYGTEWTVDVDGTETATVDVEVEPGMTGYVTIENIYNPGDLEITKLFVYEDGTQVDPADLPVGADFSFTVEVTGPSYPDGQLFTEADFTDGVLLLEDLYPGLYTVTETEYGTEWTVDVDGTETATVDVEVEPGMTGYVTIENIYNLGELEVTKRFLLPDGSIAYPDDFDADFTFTVELRLDGDLIDTKDGEGNETLTFSSLVPGTYTVIETTYGSMWEVEIGEQSVEVIAGETATVTFINNLLTETAWAAHDVAVYRYNDRGNWATYVEYERILEDGGMADIYAGQHIYVGYVEFADIGGGEVEITVYLDGWAFAPYTDNLYVQDYDNAPKGNPAPGKFEYKEEESGDGASIVVPLNNFYGIHLNVYETE